MAASCEPLGVSAAIAKALTDQAHLPGASISVADVLIETQLASSSPNVLTVSIIDPALQLATSGLLTARSTPKLDKHKGVAIGTGKAAFPVIDLSLDGGTYRLTDNQGTNDTSQPNISLELQTRAACLLRERLGPLKAIREASMTRAEFIAAVVARITAYHGIPFYCPLLEVIQPLGSQTLTLGEMERMLKLARGNKHHRGNVSLAGGRAKTTQPQIRTSGGEGAEGASEVDPSLDAEQNHNAKKIMEVARSLECSALVTLAGMETALAESNLKNEEQEGGGAQGVFQNEPETSAAAGINPWDVEAEAKEFFTQAKLVEKQTPHAQAYEIAQTVQKSGAGKASNGAANYGAKKAEAEAIIKDFGGVGSSSSSEKPYEYAIGTEEDYWQGVNKLAGEVQWYLWFGDGDTLYYWNSLELILREPMAYIDPVSQTVESDIYINPKTGTRVKGKRVKRYSDACGLFNWDVNAGSEGSSRKGGLTSECTLHIFCQPNFIRAGDVVVLTDPKRLSPWYQNGYRGRWVVVNATRSIFNVYTEVTLAIPGTAELLAPIAEPEAQTELSKESEGAGSVVDAARRALRLQQANPGTYEYSETRPMPGSLFSGTLPIRIDCSAFATLCYKAAGQPDPNGSGYDGSGFTGTLEAHGRTTTSPQPGDLAFWSSPDHVAVYVGAGKVISMGGQGDPTELAVSAETAYHASFLGYRTYTAAAPSAPKAAGDNVLHALSKRQAEADLRSLAERSPVESDLLDGGTWNTGR